MNRVLGLILAALLVALAAFFWSLREPSPPPFEGATEPAPAEATPGPQNPPQQRSSRLEVVAATPPALEVTGARLRGRVIDGLGEPLHGCEARFETEDGGSLAATTGGDGRFELAPRDSRSGWLSLAHRDFPAQVVVANLTLRKGEDRDLGDLPLASQPGLVVFVTRRGGGAIANARVSTAPALVDVGLPTRAQLLAGRQTVSDAQGKAVLYGLPTGTHTLRVEAEGYATTEQSHVQPAGLSRAPEVAVALELAAPLSGRVTSPDGGELGRTIVRAEPRDGGVSVEVSALPSGEFRLLGTAPGRYKITAESTRYVAVSVEVTAPDEAPISLLLGLGEQISGTVRARASQAPVSGALVEAEPEDGWPLQRAGESVRPSATTDASGQFRIAGLPAGRFTLRVTSEAFVSSRFGPLAAPASGLDLRLDAGLAVVGSVRLAGSPVAGASITAVDRDVDGSAFAEWRRNLIGERPRTTTSDAKGRFTLRGLIPQGQRLLIVAADCPPHLSQVLTGRDGEQIEMVGLDLTPGATLRGTAPAWSTVCLDRLGRPGLTRTTTVDAGGQFTFRGLAAGEYELFYHFPERAKPATSPAQRQASRVTVSLDAGGSLQVKLPPN